jgi:hypothetical protein
MLLLLYDEVNITGLHFWYLITHTTECDLVTLTHTLLDMYLKDLPFSLECAFLPLSVTLITPYLLLCYHPRSKLACVYNNALSLAMLTCNRRALDDLAIHGKLDCLTIVQILETDLEWMIHGGTFFGTTATTTRPTPAAEEHGE